MGRLAAIAIVLGLAAAPAAAEATATATPAARAAAVLKKGDYQTAMPWEPAQGRRLEGPSFEPGARLVVGLLLALALVGGIAFAYGVARRIRRPAVAAPPPTPAARSAPPATLPPLEPDAPLSLVEADRLAAAGAYGDAVHALLLVAIVDAARRTSSAFGPSTTARELTRLLPLEGSRHDAFRSLVATVERAVFRGGAVDAEEYDDSRVSCMRVLGSETP